MYKKAYIAVELKDKKGVKNDINHPNNRDTNRDNGNLQHLELMKIKVKDNSIEISQKIGPVTDTVVYNGYTVEQATGDYLNRILTIKS